MPSTRYIRFFLRAAFRYGVANGLTLADTLNVQVDDRFTDTKAGRVLVATSTKGHSIQFSDPSGGQLSPMAIAEILDYLLTRYDAALVELGGTPTNEQVFAAMLYRLQPVRSYHTRFTNLRA